MLSYTGALFLCASFSLVVGDCVTGFRKIGVDPIYTIKKPMTWDEVNTACDEYGTSMVFLHANLTEIRQASCGDSLVPTRIYQQMGDASYIYDEYVEQGDWESYDNQGPRLKEGGGALNITTGRWHVVKRDFKFACGLCQRDPELYLSEFNEYVESWETANTDTYQITLVSKDVNSDPAAEVSEIEKQSVLEELKVVIRKALSGLDAEEEIAFRSSSINTDDRLLMVFHCYFKNLQGLVGLDVKTALVSGKTVYNSTSLQKYETEITFINDCPEEKTNGGDGKEITWTQEGRGQSQYHLDESTGVYTRRECTYNATEFRHLWSTPSYWKTLWKPCSVEDQYLNELKYLQYLSSDSITKHNNILHQYTASPVNETTLKSIVQLLNLGVFEGADLNAVLSQDLGEILLNFPLNSNTNTYTYSTLLIQLVAIDLKVPNPYDGLALGYSYNARCILLCPQDPILVKLTSKNLNRSLEAEEKFAVQISDKFLSVSERLAFAVIWRAVRSVLLSLVMFSSDRWPRFPVVNVGLTLAPENLGTLSLDDDEFSVEISSDIQGIVKSSSPDSVLCVAWSYDLQEWTADGCVELKVTRGNLTVCRFPGKYFLQKGDKLTAKFTIMPGLDYECRPRGISNKNRAVVMGLETILFGLGLLVIVLTADLS